MEGITDHQLSIIHEALKLYISDICRQYNGYNKTERIEAERLLNQLGGQIYWADDED